MGPGATQLRNEMKKYNLVEYILAVIFLIPVSFLTVQQNATINKTDHLAALFCLELCMAHPVV